MSGTSIKRKVRKNRVKAKERQEAVRRLTKRPVLKNIDIEAIKEDFNKKSNAGKSSGDKPVKNKEVKETENKQAGNTETAQPVQSTETDVKEKAQVKEPKKEIKDKKEAEDLSSSKEGKENQKEKDITAKE